MKAILVLDEIPNACRYCYFYQSGSPSWCGLHVTNYRDIENENIRQEWCPLKPLPEKENEKCYINEMDYAYALGFNECLKQILGE